MSRCARWFFPVHRWGSWEQYRWAGAMMMRPDFEFTERREHRRCLDCGKEQDRLVRKG